MTCDKCNKCKITCEPQKGTHENIILCRRQNKYNTTNNQIMQPMQKGITPNTANTMQEKQTSKSQEKQNRSLCVSPIVTDSRQNCSDRYRTITDVTEELNHHHNHNCNHQHHHQSGMCGAAFYSAGRGGAKVKIHGAGRGGAGRR